MVQFLDKTAMEKLVSDICLSPDPTIEMELRLKISKKHPELNTFLKKFQGVLFQKHRETYFQAYLKSYRCRGTCVAEVQFRRNYPRYSEIEFGQFPPNCSNMLFNPLV